MVQGDLLRDLPEWSEELTENLEDEGMSASRDTPASTSHDSDSERPGKVISRKHEVFLLTSRKTEIAKYAREPTLQGLFAGNTLVKQYFEQKTLVT